MKISKITISVLALMALGNSAYAGGKYVEPQDAPVEAIPSTTYALPLYVGVGAIAAGLSRDCTCADGSRLKDMTYGVLARVGWDFNKYVGIEGRYLNASIEDDFSQTQHYGLYLKPQYHVLDQMNVYGLLGYGKSTVDYNNHKGKSSTLDKTGFSYGAGVEYDLSSDNKEGEYSRAFDGQGDQEKSWGIWADYQYLLGDEGTFNTDSNIFSLGVTYDF